MAKNTFNLMENSYLFFHRCKNNIEVIKFLNVKKFVSLFKNSPKSKSKMGNIIFEK